MWDWFLGMKLFMQYFVGDQLVKECEDASNRSTNVKLLRIWIGKCKHLVNIGQWRSKWSENRDQEASRIEKDGIFRNDIQQKSTIMEFNK